MSGGQAHPEELVRFNAATQKFEVGEEALRTLARHTGPIGVVAVCGRARQGKSYILNQLLGQSSGFRVAPTHRPCTKGLWMWSAPIERQAPDGSKYHLVLLDTEGIDAYDQTGQYSTQIFSLAVLLSSLFVYNQMGGIDEAALDRLSLVTEMTKHIRVRAQSGGESNDWELGEFTPSFIWLLRDFYLMLEEDGRVVTPRDYLETALAPVAGHGPSVEAKNQIRSSIKALFPDRECHTLVRPVNDERALQNLDTADMSQLRPEFRDGIAALTRAIFQRGQPKRMGRMTLTGPMFAGLTKAYVEAINNGAVPCISTAWQGVAEQECRRGAEAAEQEYMTVLNPNCGGELEQLNAEHQRCLELANKVYDAFAVGDERIVDAHRHRWQSAVFSRFENFRDKRIAEGALACERMLNQAQSRLAQMTQSGASAADVANEFDAFMEAYGNSSTATGPGKWKRLQEFVGQGFKGTLEDLDRRSKEKEAELEDKMRKEVASIRAQLNAAQQMNQNSSEVYRQQLTSTLEEKDREMRAVSSKMEADSVRMRAEIAGLKAEMTKMQSQNHEKERRVIEAEHIKRVLEDEVESLKRTLSSTQAELREVKERCDRAEREKQAAVEAASKADATIARVQVSAREDAARAARSEAAANAARSTLSEAAGDFNRRLGQWEAPSSSPGGRVFGRSNTLPVSAMTAYRDASYNSPSAAPGGFGFAAEAPASPVTTMNLDSPLPEVKGMTIAQMKDWLVRHGKEDLVSQLSFQRAKAAEWRQAIQEHM